MDYRDITILLWIKYENHCEHVILGRLCNKRTQDLAYGRNKIHCQG